MTSDLAARIEQHATDYQRAIEALLAETIQWVADTAADINGAPLAEFKLESWESPSESCRNLVSATDVHGNDIDIDELAAALAGTTADDVYWEEAWDRMKHDDARTNLLFRHAENSAGLWTWPTGS